MTIKNIASTVYQFATVRYKHFKTLPFCSSEYEYSYSLMKPRHIFFSTWKSIFQPLTITTTSLFVAENIADLIDGYCSLTSRSGQSLISRAVSNVHCIF